MICRRKEERAMKYGFVLPEGDARVAADLAREANAPMEARQRNDDGQPFVERPGDPVGWTRSDRYRLYHLRRGRRPKDAGVAPRRGTGDSDRLVARPTVRLRRKALPRERNLVDRGALGRG